MRNPSLAIAMACLGIGVSTSVAGEGGPTWFDDVEPLLKARCVKCHGPGERKAKLNLATPQGLARGGETGTAVVPGKLDEGELWARVVSDEMPPREPLSATEKETLKRWIEAGAPGMPSRVTNAPEGSEHWAFRPISRRDPAHPRRSIDEFLLDRLKGEGLTPAAEADRATLVRRLTFDLTGLPPTPEEVAAFEVDDRPDAYQRLVDQSLASPRHGARWGKYWLDAAGYSDSNGYFSADSDRPLAYRYRDWVVNAVNDDLPFDQFIRLQLAGDEVSGHRPGSDVSPEVAGMLAATHFLRNGQDGTGESDGNPDEVRADKYAVLEGAIQIIGSSLLGLTLQCARCHDHKFEPVPQRDYYALQAVLWPAFPLEKWAKPNDRVIHAASRAEFARWEAQTREINATLAKLQESYRQARRANREEGVTRFHDAFEGSIAPRWRSLDGPALGPISLDDAKAPGGFVKDGALRLRVPADPSGRRLVTSESFDWTPSAEGEWVEASFRLVSRSIDKGPVAERVGYFIAAHDGGAVPDARGNLLIDGNPAGGASVHLGYPGVGARGLGSIGTAKYRDGHDYGVRVTNQGGGKFRLEHQVDGDPEGEALTLSAEDLPDGAFGFEYCCGRSFVVDDVKVTTSDPSIAPAERKALAAKAEALKAEHEANVKRVEARRSPRPGATAWVTDLVAKPGDVPLLNRGNYGDPGPTVEPGAIGALTDPDNPYSAQPPFEGSTTTGRRLAFARWLTRPGSRPAALLARITVNRVWQYHFGTGLVATPENFGYSGAPPSHPELLEELAAGFIESGWSLKTLHRRIVTSTAYRRAGTPVDARRSAEVDPANRLLGHFPSRRLDAEALRDALLAISGELDETPSGPYVPTIRRDDGEVIVDEKNPGARRRSIYLQQRRTQLASFLEVFDTPSIVTSCPKRSVSTIPLQSLSLLNGGFARRRALALADRLEREAGPDLDARLDRAFLLAAGRPPGADERAIAHEFLQAQPTHYAELSQPEALRHSWTDLCQMLLASNAVLYVD
ncbi:MAG: DUF1553 domain-containing protein [Isosphaeraceae bacterium]